MAIEFNCPYCTASIRVADKAAGRKGTCPKCGTKLIVPTVEIPGSPPVDQKAGVAEKSPINPIEKTVAPPPPNAEPPRVEPPATASPPNAHPNEPFAFGPDSNIDISTKSAKRSTRRRKKKRGNDGLMILIGLSVAGLVVAVLLFVFYSPKRSLEGKLTARRVTTDLAAAEITQSDVDATSEEFMRAVDSLRNEPFVLSSQMLRVEFTGIENRIVIRVDPTPGAQLVAVTLDDPYLLQFVGDNRVLFGQQKLKRQRNATNELIRQLSSNTGRQISNPGEIRNAVALDALRSSFGFTVDGTVGSVLCPCVYENEQELWFPVPIGSKAMAIVGRQIPELGQMFPGRYEVTISAANEDVKVDDSGMESEIGSTEDSEPLGSTSDTPDDSMDDMGEDPTTIQSDSAMN